MNKPLDGVRILVVDDQIDVARTLCSPFFKAGARLNYVADGQAGLAELNTRPFDLAIVDMKMPPDDWGGLWLLHRMQEGGFRIPVLVLSGEGSKQQVIEALRLGAANWVDKDRASDELIRLGSALLNESLERALVAAVGRLPTPVASYLARYMRSTDPEKRAANGLHALEAVLRLTALVGLATTSPAPLRGISAANVASPSMGTWLNTCVAIADLPDAGEEFSALFSWLAPERSDVKSLRELIGVRNDLFHGRAESATAQLDRLDSLLRRFAHRAAACWRATIIVPISMGFNGAHYAVTAIEVRGEGAGGRVQLITQQPVVTGNIYLAPQGAEPASLSPWLVAEADKDSEKIRCFYFDGLQRSGGALLPSTAFRLSAFDGGPPATAGATAIWRTVEPWIDQGHSAPADK